MGFNSRVMILEYKTEEIRLICYLNYHAATWVDETATIDFLGNNNDILKFSISSDCLRYNLMNTIVAMM